MFDINKNKNSVLYQEVQRPRFLYIALIIVMIPSIFWWGFIQQIIYGVQFGDKPMSDTGLVIAWILIGVLLPLLVFQIKMITEVRADGLHIRFIPFHFRYLSFPMQNIQDYKSNTFSSLGRFGGWGIRVNIKGERAYNIAGNQGVELTLTSGDVVVIGTQQIDELNKALDEIALH